MCRGAAEHGQSHVGGDVVSLVEANKVVADDLQLGELTVIQL